MTVMAIRCSSNHLPVLRFVLMPGLPFCGLWFLSIVKAVLKTAGKFQGGFFTLFPEASSPITMFGNLQSFFRYPNTGGQAH
ncbi:hypothetical protein Barb4_01821 [Bacteroidales bacterium Barb4]|nr:hypothetical protein Barb4_01821 [Bacteroidales bacterium Barb4]